MDKQDFFNSLSKTLGEKYNISPRHISSIRSFFLGDKKNRREIAEWCVIKLNQPKRNNGKPHLGHRIENKEYYQTLLNFVASCSSETWADITQKTPFDKEGGERTTHQSQDFGNTAPTIQAHPHAE